MFYGRFLIIFTEYSISFHEKGFNPHMFIAMFFAD